MFDEHLIAAAFADLERVRNLVLSWQAPHADMCLDVCSDTCVDMCVGMCGDMCVDMCVDLCVETCV